MISPDAPILARSYISQTIIVDICSLSVFWINMSRSTRAFAKHSFMPLFIYMPLIAVRLHQNAFYGGILVLHIAYRQLNKHLLQLVTTTTNSEFYSKNYKQFIERYCGLSDEMDRVASLHSKLSEVTKAFNSVFDIQLFMWISLELNGLIMRCFLQYIGIVHLFNDHAYTEALVLHQFLNMGTIILNWLEIFFTSYTCDILTTETIGFDIFNLSMLWINIKRSSKVLSKHPYMPLFVYMPSLAANYTGVILHTVNMDTKVDIRFRRSIDTFSTHILLNQLKITGFGMFNINLRTVY
ncbi:hypothetical protein Bhyg_05706, partial [Pseudolycoriella hygida]